MRIAVIGGGPGGLYLAALLRCGTPDTEVTVWERNAAEDAFGFGVVFSDETLHTLSEADPVLHAALERHVARWDDIDVHYRGEVLTSGGHGFAAMDRRLLLRVLQQRCHDLGVRLRFRTPAPDPERLAAEYDVVVAADGVHSGVRARYADTFRPSVSTGRGVYIWLGTDLVLDAFTFHILHTPHGVAQLHGYPYGPDASTIIVETHEDVWHRAFAPIAEQPPPGGSDHSSLAALEELCGGLLHGHSLVGNASRWIRFDTVRNATWRHRNLVLLGDAAHTAHFSIGSGTKLALEDAQALAKALTHARASDPGGVAEALDAYEAERLPVVRSTQRAAEASQEWFEDLPRYTGQHPVRFAFNLLSRSRRITYDNLRLRDPEFTARVNTWFAHHEAQQHGSAQHEAQQHGVAGQWAGNQDVPPMFQPYRIGELPLRNRVLVSAMDMYSATDGVPGDFHLVHLGSKALGGAALVMTEMVCVSPQGRITPGCAGMYTAAQEAAWARVAAFVHAHTDARIGMQLGHSGRKGATRLMWEGIDEPLPEGGWPVVGPSAVPYGPDNQTPRALTRRQMTTIRDQFTAAARACARADMDLLELHCAHGYLLSSFLSPLANRRTDQYGGSADARLRYPLEVFDAVRDVWPADRPLSVRISATDWAEGGNGGADGLALARAFAAHGATAVSVSTGQVVKDEQPAYGRSYQTPYADRIRNTVAAEYPGLSVIAAGNISSYDDVNSILLAGRADLCALGRPHLYDPQWTLHAAADQDYVGSAARWPAPFRAGARPPRTGKDGPRPTVAGLDTPTHSTTRHQRWRPHQEKPAP